MYPTFVAFFLYFSKIKKFFGFFGFLVYLNQKTKIGDFGLFLPLFTTKNVVFGLFKPKILKKFLHILKVEKIPKKSRVQALKSDKNSQSYDGKRKTLVFYDFL